MANGNGNPSAFQMEEEEELGGKHGVESIISHPAALRGNVLDFWSSFASSAPPADYCLLNSKGQRITHTYNRDEWDFLERGVKLSPFPNFKIKNI